MGYEEDNKTNYVSAEQYYRESIKLNPNNAFVYTNLGNLVFRYNNNLDEAEFLYKKAIEIDAKDYIAYFNLGILLTKDKSLFNEAELAYTKAIEINPNYAHAYFNIACLRSISRKEENKDYAFKNLKMAIELDSKQKDFAKTDPDFDFIRDDPRFAEIVGE
jgi:tetratricopeptide (TPR) repeat protein